MPIYEHKQKQNRNLYNLVLFILILTIAPFILQLFDSLLDNYYSILINLIICFSLYILGLILLIYITKPLKFKKFDSFLLKENKNNYYFINFASNIMDWHDLFCLS